MSSLASIALEINGRSLQVPGGISILEAAQLAHIQIPRLCSHPELRPTASCGLCVVKLEGSPKWVRACSTPVAAGMKICTHDAELNHHRLMILELILSDHPADCQCCSRNGDCELQRVCAELGIRQQRFTKRAVESRVDNSNGCIQLDPSKCIRCGRCVQICQNVQGTSALGILGRGIDVFMGPVGGISLADSPCVRCGQCASHCPTGAIGEVDSVDLVAKMLRNPERLKVVQIAPSVRVGIGEAFGYGVGTILTGKVYAALRRLGFDYVFDTNFGADVTILEEASELLERFQNQPQLLPLLTSCCPAWVDFVEKFYPDLVPLLSSVKSPQRIMGALIKSYFARKNGIDPRRIDSVGIMPCTAKKYEIRRDPAGVGGLADVDAVLTTREFIHMIRQAGIDFASLPEELADNLLGNYSGAGTIFGNSGGVMEAALRTANHLMGNELSVGELEFSPLRGLEGMRRLSVNFSGESRIVAVVSGLARARLLLDEVCSLRNRGGPMPYLFLEVMACPGGCIAGGGQPRNLHPLHREQRADGLYRDDRQSHVRCCHENPDLQQLYREFLEKPLGEKSIHHLHTSHSPKPVYGV